MVGKGTAVTARHRQGMLERAGAKAWPTAGVLDAPASCRIGTAKSLRRAQMSAVVRAMILPAARFGIAERADVGRIERLWKRHRAAEGLDLYGRAVVASDSGDAAEADDCTGHEGNPRAMERINPDNPTAGSRKERV